ncbi:aminotransferase class V-fold PLP-dependent enzyme [Campylobacter ureolyticus]|uniref:aminotransferase class V-fold PLP-dependent enzyme n=1 Tax=Campylobacter ureolyticus TaxID=827 RepID=UPI00290EDFAE|nr:aminotransferase class V-fold PLP-dependent enzyme [Campylobacter ureolyticus]MDU7070597.1 aminotransferase class V-fold PLP-dependent enzyme [Campylobacter ureolyticus]
MIYLDNAATTFPKPKCVREALIYFFDHLGANAGRSGHKMAIEAGRVIFETRVLVANLLNIMNPLNIIFTSNATHSLNLAIKGVLKKDDVVVTSPYEHNSVMRVLNSLDVKIKILKIDKFGHIFNFKNILKDAKLVVLSHANNVNGMILPIGEIFEFAKKSGAITVLDAAQSVGLLDTDMKKLNIDLFCASGHKNLFGIQGVGILGINDNFDIVNLKPIFEGGTGSKSEAQTQPNFMPDKFESGTQNAHGIATLRAGIEFINKTKRENILRHEKELKSFLINEILKLDEFKILKTPPKYDSTGVLSIISKRLNPSELSNLLNEKGILTRASLHCNPSTHKFYGTFPKGSLRISPGFFTKFDDLNYLIDILKKV